LFFDSPRSPRRGDTFLSCACAGKHPARGGVRQPAMQPSRPLHPDGRSSASSYSGLTSWKRSGYMNSRPCFMRSYCPVCHASAWCLYDRWMRLCEQESKFIKFLGFMSNPLLVMEAAAIMAIALANGGVSLLISTTCEEEWRSLWIQRS
jgi:hypothetical protein